MLEEELTFRALYKDDERRVAGDLDEALVETHEGNANSFSEDLNGDSFYYNYPNPIKDITEAENEFDSRELEYGLVEDHQTSDHNLDFDPEDEFAINKEETDVINVISTFFL